MVEGWLEWLPEPLFPSWWLALLGWGGEKRYRDRLGMPSTLRGNATAGWHCAQQRLMAALADFVRSQPLPDFALIIDDDTYVNLRSLRRYLHSLDPSQRIYAGDGYAKLPFFFGGAGHLLSRRLLKELQGKIETCVDRTHFEWCEWHSDWVLAKCLERLGLLNGLTNAHPLFLQDCTKDDPKGFQRGLELAVPEVAAASVQRDAVLAEQQAKCELERTATASSLASGRADRADRGHGRADRGSDGTGAASLPLPVRLSQRRCRHAHHTSNFSMATCHGLTAKQMLALHRVAC